MINLQLTIAWTTNGLPVLQGREDVNQDLPSAEVRAGLLLCGLLQDQQKPVFPRMENALRWRRRDLTKKHSGRLNSGNPCLLPGDLLLDQPGLDGALGFRALGYLVCWLRASLVGFVLLLALASVDLAR